MTRKHFVAVAAIIKAQVEATTSPEAQASLRAVAVELAREFRSENPRFDSFRFITACGVKLGTVVS